jgi:hypothetical protein
VNEKCNDWDEHLHKKMFAYKITFKVTVGHIPFQLIYGLHPLMPTKCLLPLENTPMDHTSVHVLSNRIANLERLKETPQVPTKTTMK